MNEKQEKFGKMVILGNEISVFNRGNVFWLPDNTPSKGHYYIIAQAMYVDKLNNIGCFMINSEAYTINAIPVIINGTKSYINPFKLFVHRVEEFKTRNYKGTLSDKQLLNMAVNMYGMTLGIQLRKKYTEIMEEYKEYIKKFNSIHKTGSFKTVVHRDENNEILVPIKLRTDSSFLKKRAKETTLPEKKNDKNPTKKPENWDEIVGLMKKGKITRYQASDKLEIPLSTFYSMLRRDNSDFIKYMNDVLNNGETKRSMLVNTSDRTLKYRAEIAEKCAGSKKSYGLPRSISDMSIEDMQLFLYIVSKYDVTRASKIYGTSYGVVYNKVKKIKEVFDVVYQ